MLLSLACGALPVQAAELLTPGERREILQGLEELAVCRQQVNEQAAVIEKGAALVGTLREQVAAMERAYTFQERALATAERISAMEAKAIDRLERLAAIERERADRAEAKLERAEKRALWTGIGGAALTTALALGLKFLTQ